MRLVKFVIPFAPQSAMRPNYSSKDGRATRVYMPPKYRHWREKAGEWFDEWCESNDDALLKELIYVPGTNNEKLIKDQDKFVDEFYGYEFDAVFVLSNEHGGDRLFPIMSGTADLDNYAKAVIDMMFESSAFKDVGVNDRWIQSMNLTKRYTIGDEVSHIEVDIHQIRLG